MTAAGRAPKRQRLDAASEAASRQPAVTRRLGRVRWYNGRRQTGLVLADDGEELVIPAGGAFNRNLCPPTPGGLVHGTRVSFVPAALDASGTLKACVDVRPCEDCGEQPGLVCGVETRTGIRESNEDRVVACDVADIGFLAAVLDGHSGEECANFVAQSLPQMCHTMYSLLVERQPGGVLSLTSKGEEELICRALRRAFEATDRDWLRHAKKRGLNSGSTAALVLLAHGFEDMQQGGAATTGSNAFRGVAKIFVAWCGDSRVLLVRGRQGMRLSEDHKPEDSQEMERIKEAGGMVVMGSNGIYRVGRKRGRNEPWLNTSRSFGDLDLKEPTPLVIADPDIRVEVVTPDDWCVVLACDGVFNFLSDQDVVNVCCSVMLDSAAGPVEAARAIADLALKRGSDDNVTAFVMRLGWVQPWSCNKAQHGHLARRSDRRAAPPAVHRAEVEELD